MFSQTVEYALRAVVCLAHHEGTALTTRQIAEQTHVPASYASKVLQSLVRAGLVGAARGIGGGYALEGSPERISVLDVVNAIDPLRRITVCPLGLVSHANRLCPLHSKLDGVFAETERAFRATRISELLTGRSRQSPLCELKSV